MAEDSERSVQVTRLGLGSYEAVNARGGTLRFASDGSETFTPVELLLTAIAGCMASDVDHITAKRSEPTSFTIRVRGDKVRDSDGNRMEDLAVTFEVGFPDGADGDAARKVLPEAVRRSHDRLCTVSRTVEQGTPVSVDAV